MKLAEIRRRGVELRLREHQLRIRRGLPAAVVMTLVFAALFLLSFLDPVDWATGPWYKPGGLLYDRFGWEGAVLVSRVAAGLLAVLFFVWTARAVYRLNGGLAARRRRIADEYDIFDPPDRDRLG